MKGKKLREKGKIGFSGYFKELKKGEKVAVKRELAVVAGFPKRIEGKTGEVIGEKGKAYIIKIRGKSLIYNLLSFSNKNII